MFSNCLDILYDYLRNRTAFLCSNYFKLFDEMHTRRALYVIGTVLRTPHAVRTRTQALFLLATDCENNYGRYSFKTVYFG
jgi:hypothetical protein